MTPRQAAGPIAAAAAELVRLMAADLAERGGAGTQVGVAAVLGIAQPRISDVVRGSRGTLDLLARWAELWAAAGGARFRLVVEPGEVRVERAD